MKTLSGQRSFDRFIKKDGNTLSLRVRGEVAAEKKKGKKLSLSQVLDELENKSKAEAEED